MSARRPDLAELDFANFARQFDRCLRQDKVIAFSRWRDIVEAVPPGLKDFFWRVVEAHLSPAAETRLRGLRDWRDFHGEVLDTRFRRPSAERPQFRTPKQEFDSYSAIFWRFGSTDARFDQRFGRLVLLALRKESSTIANRGKGSYDDLVVVMRRTGRFRELASFPICTEPGAQYSQRASGGDARYKGVKFSKADGVDINKDGIKDAGRLTEGTYQYFEKKGGFLGDRAFQVKSTQVAERDTDGDGRFTQDDKSRIDPSGAGTSMYIHRGGADNVLEPNTWSAGCQTIPKNRYPTFLKAVGTPGAFYYVLVNAAS
ncbi:hypothetical protein SAMN04515666_110216 [Bosea lupini]|jgi:hypothetical protein|uniref:Uncharacterized protein n=1 Tax=Bosea lupini TaxID=1036779 RepID=A0A1H7XX80_9HYPH|nr:MULTISPECIES: hypothetical protein [Bosea]SEM38204.1 hypothetical protein SAMN04515666_110216 [Bosea lupini]